MTNGKHLPNVWGAGQLLAFSGMDGYTQETAPFVLHTAERPGSLTVLLPVRADVAFEGMAGPRFSMILGDAIAADFARGAFLCAFMDHHTLVGEMPPNVRLVVGGKPIGEAPEEIGEGEGLKLLAAAAGTRWVLMVKAVGAESGAADLAATALSADLTATVNARAAYVADLEAPAGLDADGERLLRKAVSVMKVNTHAPCGRIRRRWTTPDRWPHRHMWLWDSAFHGVGMMRVVPDTAKEIVLAMLEQVQEEGWLPHRVSPTLPLMEVSQPPILGWAVWNIFELTGDQAWAAECKPYLFRYLEWMRLNRDKNGNGLPEWLMGGDPRCRSGESGLDNSPRFDGAVQLDAVDFGSFLCSDYQCLAAIAERLGDKATQKACVARAERISTAVNNVLWAEHAEFYLDRDFDGNFVDVKAVSGFMPLFAGIADAEQADALRKHLNNPDTFDAPLPVPSVALDSGFYCKDMWRGPTWMNTNYLVYCGLRRYGFDEEAACLREKSLRAVRKWYEREGCFFEFYDSLDITCPRDLDRKQQLSLGTGITPITDYHWTAATAAAWMLETD